MNQRSFLRILPLAAGLLVLLQVQCLLIPDDTQKGQRVANQRPEVRITAGAASPDSGGVDYKVLFQWNGSDRDGVVSLYQWASDDTLSEKAWQDTTGYSATLVFSATSMRPDSLFTDWHTFFIRAIDNEFAMSLPDKRYFNARTIAPTSHITQPNIRSILRPLQRTFTVEWDGEDLDSSRPDRKPLYYEYKLVRIPNKPDSIHSERSCRWHLLTDDNVLLDTLRIGSKLQWIRVVESERSTVLQQLQPSSDLGYVFGVRAVDEAGATEPALDLGRNVMSFDVGAEASTPDVTISEESLGSFTYPTNGDVWEVSVPSNRAIRFKWVGDASSYGSKPGNVNYALDIPDPDDETLHNEQGIGGWIGWGKWTGNQTPFVFTDDEAGVHTFYVLMRDVSDEATSTRRCTVKMNVVSFTFSKFALFVDDDLFPSGALADSITSEFYRNSLLGQLYRLGSVDEFNVYQKLRDPRSGRMIERGAPERIPLEVISNYRHVVWSVNAGTNSGANSGFVLNEGLPGDQGGGLLTSFLNAGGRLFIYGGKLSGALLHWDSYPREPDPLNDPKTFFYRYLFLRNTLYSRKDPSPCITREGGLFVARSLNPAYPDLFLDTSKWNPWELLGSYGHHTYKGGMDNWEGVKKGQNQVVPPEAGLDSLYKAETWNRFYTEDDCMVDLPGSFNSIIAQRYESTHADTLISRQRGRTIFFNFQPFYFQRDQIADAGSRAVNWLVTGRDY